MKREIGLLMVALLIICSGGAYALERTTEQSCADYCADGVRYYEGVLERTGCIYQAERCVNGCEGDACAVAYTRTASTTTSIVDSDSYDEDKNDIECPNVCEYGIYFSGGYMGENDCQYGVREHCENGCDENGCIGEEEEPECPDKCEGDILNTEGVMYAGVCGYTRVKCEHGCYESRCMSENMCPDACDGNTYYLDGYVNPDGICEYRNQAECPNGCDENGCIRKIISEDEKNTEPLLPENPEYEGTDELNIDVEPVSDQLGDELMKELSRKKAVGMTKIIQNIENAIEEIEPAKWMLGLRAFWPEKQKDADYYGSEVVFEDHFDRLKEYAYVEDRYLGTPLAYAVVPTRPDQFTFFLPGDTCDLVVDLCVPWDRTDNYMPSYWSNWKPMLDRVASTEYRVYDKFGECPNGYEENDFEYYIYLSNEMMDEGFPYTVSVTSQMGPDEFSPVGAVAESKSGVVTTIQEGDYKKFSLYSYDCKYPTNDFDYELEPVLPSGVLNKDRCKSWKIEELDSGWHFIKLKGDISYARYTYACRDDGFF